MEALQGDLEEDRRHSKLFRKVDEKTCRLMLKNRKLSMVTGNSKTRRFQRRGGRGNLGFIEMDSFWTWHACGILEWDVDAGHGIWLSSGGGRRRKANARGMRMSAFGWRMRKGYWQEEDEMQNKHECQYCACPLSIISCKLCGGCHNCGCACNDHSPYDDDDYYNFYYYEDYDESYYRRSADDQPYDYYEHNCRFPVRYDPCRLCSCTECITRRAKGHENRLELITQQRWSFLLTSAVELLAAREVAGGIAMLRTISLPTPSFEILRAMFAQNLTSRAQRQLKRMEFNAQRRWRALLPLVRDLPVARNVEDGIAMLRTMIHQKPSFEILRAKFLQSHGKAIVDALVPLWGESVSLSPVPLTSVVQKRFLKACHSDPHALLPTFHGTDITKFISIFCRGLLVPGVSGIRVANGNAHGPGIYTAKLSAASLALGFARGSNKLLVCGVVDDTPNRSFYRQQIPGWGFAVTARSKTQLHVGDAVVVQDRAIVAPLFVAERKHSEGDASKSGKCLYV